MSPPPAKAAVVWAMADVLEVDMRPDGPPRPPVGLDATRPHLVADTRAPRPASPGPPARVDDEEERHGTATRFLVFAPWAGPRRGTVTERRTAVDCAPLRQDLGAGPSPQADTLVWVMDPRTTPQRASLDDALAPPAAWRVMERRDRHDTPQHGRWWHLAETARSVLATPGVDRRMPPSTTLPREGAAWERPRKAAPCRMHWRFTTPDARIKLKRLYPSLQLG